MNKQTSSTNNKPYNDKGEDTVTILPITSLFHLKGGVLMNKNSYGKLVITALIQTMTLHQIWLLSILSEFQ